MDNKNYVVYLLVNTDNNRTYVGITNNSTRRLRQHNSEIKGGARYTTSQKGDGEWEYYLHITNLTKSEALSLERTIKNKKGKGKKPIDKRLDIIKSLPDIQEQIVYFDENINEQL